MSGLAYMRFELTRALRNRRFFVFSLGFPLVLYVVIAGATSKVHNYGGTGISAPLYYMVGLASFGTMMAMISSGARIAGEREAGWTRQLRITPLSPRAYFRAKLVTSYAMAILSLVLLYLAGAAFGVSLSAGSWLAMTGLLIVGLLPFAALGIALGHMMTVDSIGPMTGGLVSLLALISGVWFPVTSGFLHAIARWLPSYWLVQASHASVGGKGWSLAGWLVVACWTVALVVLARFVYKRDTGRV